MVFFTKNGFWDALRYFHVLSAVMWMGLLWFFNLIQTPAYNDMSGPAKNEAFDKLTWRALWWFRWAAVAVWVTGILVLGAGGFGTDGKYASAYWKQASGMMIAAAILFAFIMLYNVWMVIWPNQQIVIGNARNVLAGKEADPAAAAAARKAAMASRQNTIFSITVFLGMVGFSHFFSQFDSNVGSGTRIAFYLIVLAIAVVFELNALGMIGGTAAGGLNVIYDTHQKAIMAGAAIAVVLWLFMEIAIGKPADAPKAAALLVHLRG